MLPILYYSIRFRQRECIINNIKSYSIFVQKVRDGLQNGLELRTAIRQAITYL